MVEAHINVGSTNAVLALSVAFSGFFLIFAALSLPWSWVQLAANGGWRRGWRLGPGSRRSLQRSADIRLETQSLTRSWHPPAIAPTRKHLRRIPLPPGIPLHSSILPWINLSSLQIAIFLPFLLVTLLCSYVGSDFVEDSSRTGYVALAMLCFVAGLAIKSFGLGTLLQQGYTSVNWLHRWLGRLVFLVITLHTAGYLVKFHRDGTLAMEMRRKVNIMAWISYAGLTLMVCASIHPLRRKHYQAFKWAHHIGLIFFIAGLNFHSRYVLPVLLTLIFYIAANFLYRWSTSRHHIAQISTTRNSRTTLVSIPTLNAGFWPGQHVRIRFFSRRFGVAGLESHPFSIACSERSRDEEGGMRLLIKANGDWTDKLHQLALEGLDGRSDNTLRLAVEGPYGQMSFSISVFSSAVVFAGGSGVSFALSVVQSAMDDLQAGTSRIRDLTLVWTVREAGELELILPLLSSILKRNQAGRFSLALDLSIMVYVTSKESPDVKSLDAEDSRTLDRVAGDAEGGPAVHYGSRPPTAKIIEEVVGRTYGKGGAVVAACGPATFVDLVGRQCASLDKSLRDRAGGVEFMPSSFVL